MPNVQVWNSLEAAKLLTAALTPLCIVCVGVYVNRLSKRYEDSIWRSQKLIEKRLAVYDSIVPELNDLLCYFTYVGSWKELSPTNLVTLKRSLDKKIYLARPLFTDEFYCCSMAFLKLCYSTYNGWGKDPKLRTLSARRRDAAKFAWAAELDEMFTEEDLDTQEFVQLYDKVMLAFSSDIGIHREFKSTYIASKAPESRWN